MTTQLTFDIDSLIHETEIANLPAWEGAPLHFTTKYFTADALAEAFKHWQFVNGAFGSCARSHMWNESAYKKSQLGNHSIRFFNADLRCSVHIHRANDHGVGDLITQIICETCDWHIIGQGDNALIEQLHDHTHPTWRQIPVLPSDIPRRNDKGITKEATVWISTNYTPDQQQPGSPIRTTPQGQRTGHIRGYSPWGGFDLAAP